MENLYDTAEPDSLLKKMWVAVASKIRTLLPSLYYEIPAAIKSIFMGILTQIRGK